MLSLIGIVWKQINCISETKVSKFSCLFIISRIENKQNALKIIPVRFVLFHRRFCFVWRQLHRISPVFMQSLSLSLSLFVWKQWPTTMKNPRGINFNRLDHGSEQKQKVPAEKRYYTNDCPYWAGCQSKLSWIFYAYIWDQTSINLILQIFSRRCGRRPGRRHHSRIDCYSTSACLFGNRRTRTSRKWHFILFSWTDSSILILSPLLLFSLAYTAHSWVALCTLYWARAKTCRWDRQQSLHC